MYEDLSKWDYIVKKVIIDLQSFIELFMLSKCEANRMNARKYNNIT